MGGDRSVFTHVRKWLALTSKANFAPGGSGKLRDFKDDRLAGNTREPSADDFGAAFRPASLQTASFPSGDDEEPNFATGIKLAANASSEIEIPVTAGSRFAPFFTLRRIVRHPAERKRRNHRPKSDGNARSGRRVSHHHGQGAIPERQMETQARKPRSRRNRNHRDRFHQPFEGFYGESADAILIANVKNYAYSLICLKKYSVRIEKLPGWMKRRERYAKKALAHDRVICFGNVRLSADGDGGDRCRLKSRSRNRSIRPRRQALPISTPRRAAKKYSGVAVGNRRLWTESVDMPNGFDRASRAAILFYALELDAQKTAENKTCRQSLGQ